MFNCDIKSFCGKFKCKTKETDEGIQINISPKDKSKTESLKAMSKACKDFCDCDCD
jgi:hypothetical protein